MILILRILIAIIILCIIDVILDRKMTEYFYSVCQPIFEPKKWNKKYIKKSHNCYSYSMNQLEKEREKKCYNLIKNKKKCKQRGPPRPSKKIYTFPKGKKVTCDSIMYGVNKNIPGVDILKNKNSKCPDDKYKVALFIDDKNKSYHFLRQDKCNNKEGIWSHKNAKGPVTQLDAANNIIYNPEHANLNYSWVNYNHMCDYICVPDNNHLKPAI
tara:strand:+ start:486 stop:1124 length:639 start_codon:yes stop_codon:yes gene_type:complete